MNLPAADIRLDGFGVMDVEAVLSWQYDGDYASDDLAASDRATFADPASD